MRFIWQQEINYLNSSILLRAMNLVGENYFMLNEYQEEKT